MEKQKIVVQRKKYVPKEKSSQKEAPVIPVKEQEDINLVEEIQKEAEKELNVETSSEDTAVDLELLEEVQREAEKLMQEETPEEETVVNSTAVEEVKEEEEIEIVVPVQEDNIYVRIIQKAPTRYRLLLPDGGTRWIQKKDHKDWKQQ